MFFPPHHVDEHNNNVMAWYLFQYTTAEVQALEPEFNKSDFKAPMAGFGYGLPISRLVSGFLLIPVILILKLY